MNNTRLEYSALIGTGTADISLLKAAQRWDEKGNPIRQFQFPNPHGGMLSYMEDNNPPCPLLYDDDNKDWSVPVLNRDHVPNDWLAIDLSHHDLTALSGIDEDFIQLKPYPPNIKVKHPEFSEDIQLDTPESLSEFWGGQKQNSEESRYWSASAAKYERDRLKLENRVHQYCDEPELLFWAGIISKEEAEELECARPDLEMLNTLMNDEEFPEMELMFFEGRLCINEVPTIIREDDLRDLYNGHTAFNGSEEAKKVVISTIKKLLIQLFRKE